MRSVLLLACGSLLIGACPLTYADDVFIWPDDDERRDPFTFAPRVLNEPPPPPPVPSPLVQDLSRQVMEAESGLLALEPRKALATCDAALKAARETVAENTENAQRLACIRKAAEQMLRRQQAEAAFAALEIRISGAVCHGKKSVAIINGNRVSQGDVVAVSEAESLVAEEIGADRITFVFRGYRFAREY
jgi:hypothetical protein